jgi:tripartite-type tricarboxylate transporter receptor subunit TctC
MHRWRVQHNFLKEMKMKQFATKAFHATLLTAAFFGICAQGTFAQEFPTKPVKITTGFPVGSGPEGVLRLVAEQLSKTWGKPVVVENRPGANGFIAIDAVKRAAPDGYELLQMDTSQMTVYQSLFKKLPYDTEKDFDAIMPLFKNYFMVVVAKDSPYQSMKDIVADAKKKGAGRVNYGSWSIGNPVHIASSMIEAGTATEMTHVTYKETSALYLGVASKELDWALGSIGTAGALQRADKIRYIGVTAPKRMAELPNIATVAESGGPANYEFSAWTALVAPKGTPAAVLDKIQKDVSDAIASVEMRAKFAALAYEQYPMSREQSNTLLKNERAVNGAAVKRLNVQLD